MKGDTKGFEHYCELCGRPLPQKAGRGRVSKRHPECKRFANAYDAMDRALMDLRDSGLITYKNVRDIRSRLWCTANDLNTIGDDRGRLRRAALRDPVSELG